MVITNNLENRFDEVREISTERLDVLKSLGIDPEFAEACEKMFENINASVKEVMEESNTLNEENNLITGKMQIETSIKEAANNRVYRSHQESAS